MLRLVKILKFIVVLNGVKNKISFLLSFAGIRIVINILNNLLFFSEDGDNFILYISNFIYVREIFFKRFI